ncbi:MAG: mechanosensitive ion channel family protein [Anaerolineae bacterium]|jgi:small-conductance mechanosensitive channel
MDLGAPFQTLIEQVLRFIPRLIAALVIFVATLLLSSVAARWARRSAQSKIDDLETLSLISRLTRWGVLVLGTVLALDQVNFDVTGFVAGLGIAGITIGFALQDIARNFVAGILLLVQQPFDLGDVVEVADYTGTVLEISIRDTVIKSLDGEKVILPNIDVLANAITNYSDLPLRRRTVRIGLGYDEDVDHASEAFLQAIQALDGVLEEPEPSLLAEDLGDSTVGLVARFWVNQESEDLFQVHSRAVQAIKETAEREEIDLPYPIQTVRLEGASL